MGSKIKIKVKDKLEDDTLDLSWCDLDEVPIREIATIKKATNLDLSNNQLISLPKTIVTLTNITKLDLSKNMLTEIPENIGEMKQLKHLDLYSNRISRLPLSLGDLKNLKWLDLKENPLTPAVASIAGLCSNSSECQACARNIVRYLIQIRASIEQEKVRRSIAAPAVSNGEKKEPKKKKKKTASKDDKQNLQQASLHENSRTSGANPIDSQINKKVNDDMKSPRGFCGRLCGFISSAVVFTIFLAILVVLTIILLPKFDKNMSDKCVDYLQVQTSLPVKQYQKLGIEVLDKSGKYVIDNLSEIYYDLLNKTKAFQTVASAM